MKTGLAPLGDGGTLAYTLRGDGPPLVLISGLGGVASFWNAFAEICAPYFQVVTYDHRGVGGSSALEGPTSIDAMRADLTSLLDHLGIASAAILGHSSGGASRRTWRSSSRSGLRGWCCRRPSPAPAPICAGSSPGGSSCSTGSASMPIAAMR